MNTNKAPDKIYVREFAEGLSQMWSSSIATETAAIAQHEYIRKDALLEWLEKANEQALIEQGEYNTGTTIWEEVIDKINSM